MCRGCASLIRPFRSSHRLWSTVSKAVPYTVIPKILYTKTVQSLLQPTSLVYMWSARLYPTVMPKILYTKTVQSLLQPTSVVHSQQGRTLHSHVKDIIHQDSAVCLTATWSTVSKAVPYTATPNILYTDSAVCLTATWSTVSKTIPYTIILKIL